MEEGKKFDTEKPDYSLIPPFALEELAKLLTFGAKKYSRDNWRKVRPPIRYYSAAMRHAWAWMRGEMYDPESGIHHLICAACSLMFLYEMEDVERIQIFEKDT